MSSKRASERLTDLFAATSLVSLLTLWLGNSPCRERIFSLSSANSAPGPSQVWAAQFGPATSLLSCAFQDGHWPGPPRRQEKASTATWLTSGAVKAVRLSAHGTHTTHAYWRASPSEAALEFCDLIVRREERHAKAREPLEVRLETGRLRRKLGGRDNKLERIERNHARSVFVRLAS